MPTPGAVCLLVVSSAIPAAILWSGRVPGVGQLAEAAACCDPLVLLVLLEEGCQPFSLLPVQAEDGMGTSLAGLQCGPCCIPPVLACHLNGLALLQNLLLDGVPRALAIAGFVGVEEGGEVQEVVVHAEQTGRARCCCC